MEITKVLWQSTLSFLVLFVISKVLGKRQIAQLEFTDYVIGISLGSIAANMVMEPEIPYYHFIIGMAVFGFLDLFIAVISRKGVFLKKLFIGKPSIIIEKGEINYKNLKKSKLDINELVSQCRIAGYFNLSEVYYCIFEPNGGFSIMPRAEIKPTIKSDFSIKGKQEEMCISLIVDGKVKTKHLKELNKTQDWLFNKLNILTQEDLRNILLASFDPVQKKFSVFTKKNSISV